VNTQPKGRSDRVEQGNAPVDDGAKEAGVGRPSSANPRLPSPVYPFPRTDHSTMKP